MKHCLGIFLALFVITAHTATWAPLANEGATVKLPTLSRVRYGAQKTWLEREVMAGDLACNNATFGRDPLPNVAKTCQVSSERPAVASGCGMLSPAAVNFRATVWPAGMVQFMASTDPKAAFYLTWWCEGKFDYTRHMLVGFRTDIPVDMPEVVAWFVKASETDRAALIRVQSKCPAGTDRTSSACQRYAPLFAVGWQQLAFSNPPPIVWKVAKNGAAVDRPMYPTTNGKRTTTAAKFRAPVGEVCRCTELVVEEAANSYCAIRATIAGPNAGLVTLCSR